MSRRLAARAAVLAAAAALLPLLAGCEDARPGSIVHAPVAIPRLPARSGVPLGIATPRDARPPIEHAGDDDHMKVFFTLAVVTHWEKAGNYVTNDMAATVDAPGELATVLGGALARAQAARVVPPDSRPAFVLETEIQHLYATHYAANEGTLVIVPGRGGAPRGGGANVQSRVYADYGNAVIRARLVDHRTQPPRVVMDEVITGAGEAPPRDAKGAAAQQALNSAVADAALALTIRVSAALDRLGAAPHAEGIVNAHDMPPVFIVERVSRLRDFLERVTVQTASGRALRHDIVPLADRSYARPGDWLLSRTLPDGTVLSGDDYDVFARKLATGYDLRAYDDAQRYHFFGVKGVIP